MAKAEVVLAVGCRTGHVPVPIYFFESRCFLGHRGSLPEALEELLRGSEEMKKGLSALVM